MQQNSSPDCRFHTNQPRKFTKRFSQLLKCTKRFSLQASANLQHDHYWEESFLGHQYKEWLQGVWGKKIIRVASTYYKTSLLSSWMPDQEPSLHWTAATLWEVFEARVPWRCSPAFSLALHRIWWCISPCTWKHGCMLSAQTRLCCTMTAMELWDKILHIWIVILR